MRRLGFESTVREARFHTSESKVRRNSVELFPEAPRSRDYQGTGKMTRGIQNEGEQILLGAIEGFALPILVSPIGDQSNAFASSHHPFDRNL